ncbi:unnamed protein product [Paramecium sonneborni]|uniref:Uncharacterized protein n=1 Tax=Paramecium sonneborni TaxID=65129 RepID=A0A8S1RS26_9CILI|nr:unnamed protein product [Paramecium sonneborni]
MRIMIIINSFDQCIKILSKQMDSKNEFIKYKGLYERECLQIKELNQVNQINKLDKYLQKEIKFQRELKNYWLKLNNQVIILLMVSAKINEINSLKTQITKQESIVKQVKVIDSSNPTDLRLLLEDLKKKLDKFQQDQSNLEKLKKELEAMNSLNSDLHISKKCLDNQQNDIKKLYQQIK